METILPKYPSNAGDLIRLSLRLYKYSFSNVLLLALVLSFISFIPRFAIYGFGTNFYLAPHFFSYGRLILFVLSIICIIFFIALIWRIHCANHYFREPFKQDFLVALRKIINVFIAALIQSIILMLLTLVIFSVQYFLTRYNLLFINHLGGFIFTGIIFIGQFLLMLYVSTLFIFFVPLITIENKGVFSALKRSAYLVYNNWWRTLSLQLFPWICFILALLLLRFVLQIDIHIFFIDNKSHPLWASLLQLLIFALFIPWVAALLLSQLNDLEVRKHTIPTGENAL